MSTRGWETATMADMTRRELQQRATMPQKPRSKYNARKTTVDGIVFDSAKEAARYGELKLLQKAGKIFRLTLQPKFRLCAWRGAGSYANDGLIAEVYGRGRTIQEPPHVGNYVADFSYCNTKACICANGCQIEDVKGFKTPLYRWKRKHVEAQYGIQIREV